MVTSASEPSRRGSWSQPQTVSSFENAGSVLPELPISQEKPKFLILLC